MASNTLGDGEDDFVFDENVWDDPEADALIANINEEEILARAYGNDEDEVQAGQDDPEADALIANINEDEILATAYGNDQGEVQAGRGEKREYESDQESETEDEQGQYYYELDTEKKYHCKKFGMSGIRHRVLFNNVLADLDLLESYRSTHEIIHHLLEDVTEGMAPNDQVRFVLWSEQLETPISLPYMSVERLTTEQVFAALERVIQSNQEFRFKRYGNH